MNQVAPDEIRTAVIRTSDRSTRRRCKRLWGWSSHLGRGLESTIPALPLWIGTGFHYGLEDYHGYQHYGTGAEAFAAFVDACRRTPEIKLPDDWEEGLELAAAMLDYYTQWEISRPKYETLWIDGIPQVEIDFEIELPFDATKFGYDRVLYRGTFDRIATDEYGGLWVIEYKTAKAFETRHFMTDQQVSSYVWAGTVVYDKPVMGVVYQQHKKVIPLGPRVLRAGQISTASNMISSYRLYKTALEKLYTSVEKAPGKNQRFLGDLAAQETEHRDAYIMRDLVTRNEYQIAAEGTKILLECEEMLNPDLPLYPSPTRDCHFCSFMDPCISLDDGSDWEAELDAMSQSRAQEYNTWRPHLQLPSPP